MTTNIVTPPHPDTRDRLALAVGATLFVAGLLLVTAVLPAEYGLDPLGTGRVLGLTAIAGEGGAAAGGTSLEPVRPGANMAQTAGFRRDSMTFQLKPDEGVEYKYQMGKGTSLVYTWLATGTVEFDFHGEPVGSPRGYAESYEMGQKTRADGAFFAPTTGIHGWYWKNLTRENVTVTLTSAGFYSGGLVFNAEGRTEKQIPAEP